MLLSSGLHAAVDVASLATTPFDSRGFVSSCASAILRLQQRGRDEVILYPEPGHWRAVSSAGHCRPFCLELQLLNAVQNPLWRAHAQSHPALNRQREKCKLPYVWFDFTMPDIAPSPHADNTLDATTYCSLERPTTNPYRYPQSYTTYHAVALAVSMYIRLCRARLSLGRTVSRRVVKDFRIQRRHMLSGPTSGANRAYPAVGMILRGLLLWWSSVRYLIPAIYVSLATGLGFARPPWPSPIQPIRWLWILRGATCL